MCDPLRVDRASSTRLPGSAQARCAVCPVRRHRSTPSLGRMLSASEIMEKGVSPAPAVRTSLRSIGRHPQIGSTTRAWARPIHGAEGPRAMAEGPKDADDQREA